MGFSLRSLLGPIGTAAGAVFGLSGMLSAKDAEKAQREAAAQSINEQRRQFDLNRADFAPYREAGAASLSQLQGLMNNGDLTRRFTTDDFYNDPVAQLSMQYGLDQGIRGLNNTFGAAGNQHSGAALKALTRFGTDYGSQQAGQAQQRFVNDQTNLYNRYANLAGLGQTATNATANLGANTANQISNTLQGLGNARGASAIAQTNAMNQGVGNYLNYSLGQQYLGMLPGLGGGSVGGMPAGLGYGNNDFDWAM